MIGELDIVALTVDRPDHGLEAGQSGTILEQFTDTEFLVEFSSEDGEVFELVFASANQLLKLLPTTAAKKDEAAAA